MPRFSTNSNHFGKPTVFGSSSIVGVIGDDTQADVEAYIERQVGKELLVDEAFLDKLRQFTVVNPGVDLAAPTSTKRGRYLQLAPCFDRTRAVANQRSEVFGYDPRPMPQVGGISRLRSIAVVDCARPHARRCEATSLIRRKRWL